FKTPSVHHLSFNVELLSLGDLELLVLAILHREDDSSGWIHMPHGSRYALHRRDRLGCGCHTDRALQLHTRLEVVDTKLLPVDSDSRTFGYVGHVTEATIRHLP